MVSAKQPSRLWQTGRPSGPISLALSSVRIPTSAKSLLPSISEKVLPVSRCNILPLHGTISKHCLRISALELLFSKAAGQRHNAGSTLRLHPAPNLLQCLSYIVGTTYKD
ncbi:unnamed protein product [Tetraodon nigroviridis]|uniref:Chromosome 8 SCAF14525, whole genome shotgun sequence n=1 Tax=Tetraodon nigroviridis TaxID=99883 RepID=Q4SRK1_TETNG|nr:unnamed protein product [Tetraodon nigroviridis]